MHHHSQICPGCNTELGINFCPRCGQEAVLHPPSAREFVVEFIGHHIALEGKLWRTLGLLIFRPGALTQAYMAGRRVAYMQPLRLFLTMSVILFTLLEFGGFAIGTDATSPNDTGRLVAKANIRELVPPQANAAAGKDYALSVGYYTAHLTLRPHGEDFGFTLLLPDENETSPLMSAIRRGFPSFDDRIHHFTSLPPAQQAERMTHGFFSRMPYVIFCMVPVFALLLKLLYLRSGRRYGEYLLFALHINAFAFFIMILMQWAPVPWGLLLLVAWLLCYIGRAMHKVYAGSVAATVLRWLALSVGYLAILVVLITQLMLMMALTR